MALQIANPIVVKKIERLAIATGLTKTAAVEKAVDRFLQESVEPEAVLRRMKALVRQMNRIPDVADPFDPHEWDEHGLPR